MPSFKIGIGSDASHSMSHNNLDTIFSRLLASRLQALRGNLPLLLACVRLVFRCVWIDLQKPACSVSSAKVMSRF